MSLKSFAVTTIESAGIKLLEKGAAEIIRSLPKPKQNKVITGLFVAGTLMVLFAAIMLAKRRAD